MQDGEVVGLLQDGEVVGLLQDGEVVGLLQDGEVVGLLQDGEVVGLLQNGEVVGLLQVVLWAGTLENLEGVTEGSGEGRRPEMDKETMTCCKKKTQPTHLWYTRGQQL